MLALLSLSCRVCLGDALSPRDFVEQHARQHGLQSAYTVLPVRHGRMLDFPFHLRRLALSLDQLTATKSGARSIELSHQLEYKVSRALAPWYEESRSGFLTLCAVITACGEPQVDVLFSPSETVPGLPSSQPLMGIAIDTAIYKRGNSAAKYSLWTLERKPIEFNRHPGATETILIEMTNSTALLLEGLTSNVFVIENGELVTAADGVLQGSMAHLLLQHCRNLGVPLALRKPCIADAHQWTAVFLTSALDILVSPLHQ